MTEYNDTGELKLLLNSCIVKNRAAPQNSPLYNEVFVITQSWAGAYFHKNIENIPRIAPYIKFLMDNVDIKIHVFESKGRTAEILQLLGIVPSRLVTGMCRAKIVYLPQSTSCGRAQASATQLLASLYHEHLHESASPLPEADTVILIQRRAL